MVGRGGGVGELKKQSGWGWRSMRWGVNGN